MAEPLTLEQLAVIKSLAYTTSEGREFVFVHEITAALGAQSDERPQGGR
ncbi:hypothetical protein AB0F88_39725 [Streptosporangium sp. NPDC023963]